MNQAKPKPDISFFADESDFSERSTDHFVTPRCPETPVNVDSRSRHRGGYHQRLSSPLAVERNNCYERISPIYRSKFSTVEKVSSDGEIYALKTSVEFKGKNHRQKILVEGAIVKFLIENPHPNILRFVESFEEDGRLYIVSEYCETTLEMFMERHGWLDEEYIWKILVELVLGLNHLHTCRIVHRDLKPENILVRSNGDTVICDFSISTEVDMPVSNDGDSRYLSPEQQVSEPNSHMSADIFSLGVILYELASNLRVPLNLGGGIWQSDDQKIKYLQERSSDLNELFMSMLNKDPTRRPTCESLLHSPKISSIVANRQDQFNSVFSYVKESYLVEGLSKWWKKMIGYKEDSHIQTKKNPLIDTTEIVNMERQLLLSPPPVTTPLRRDLSPSFRLDSGILTFDTPEEIYQVEETHFRRGRLFSNSDDESSFDDKLELASNSDSDTNFMELG